MEDNNSSKKQDFNEHIDNRPKTNHSQLKNQLKLREVKKDDVTFLFELRNDPSVRESSFHVEPIGLTDHKKWFQEKLKAKNSLILIAEYGEQRVGQIRFDIGEMANRAEVSIGVLPKFRQKGFGVKILKIGCKLASKNLQISSINAFIKKENLISIRTFSKAGFEKKGYLEYKGYHSMEMELDVSK
ncbi:MAG: GNAT family N-acetyltransferase [Candidatus Heimdallarchaeota archaeon]|nr:MAG: GNAT family N-acetyltransferase [Candidatus Heimdallarchaeota archaeon]